MVNTLLYFTVGMYISELFILHNIPTNKHTVTICILLILSVIIDLIKDIAKNK